MIAASVSSARVARLSSEIGRGAKAPLDARHSQVRENRYVVLPKDLDAAYKKHVNKANTDFAFYTH